MQYLRTLLAYLLVVMTGACLAQSHRFDVRDSIAMAHFSEINPISSGNGFVRASPDGKYIALVTSKGQIQSNKTQSLLWLFDVSDLHKFVDGSTEATPPHPKLLAKIAAIQEVISVVAYAPVITQVIWSHDSQSVFFLGQNSRGEHQLYRAYVTTGKLMQVTPRGIDVLRYVADRDLVVVKGISCTQHETSKETNAISPHVATGMRITEILFPSLQESPKVPQLWLISGGRLQRVTSTDEDQAEPGISIENAWDTSLSASAKSHLAVWLAPVNVIYQGWENYKTAIGSEHFRLIPGDQSRVSATSLNRVQHYVITDLLTGKTSTLVDAPAGRALGYSTMIGTQWSGDGRFLLVTNTFLPLTGVDFKERERRILPCTVAVHEVATNDTECVVFTRPDPNAGSLTGTLDLRSASFGGSDDVIIVRTAQPGKSERITIYQREHQGWVEQSENADLVHGSRGTDLGSDMKIRIYVKEGLNVPPALWVSDPTNDRSRMVWDPNPQLRSMQIGRVTVYHWKDNTGYEWTGGLVWPVNYIAGRRYPLVIQMYQFRENEFMTDGTAPTAMAARPLASAGIFYLQGERKPKHTFDAKEADDHLAGILSAIDHLAKAGLVDPKRVGLIGFSWTCWYVENALIKAPNRFAAATLADGPDNSYMQYRLIGVGNAVEKATFERINGGEPVGDGLDRWVASAPSFHLDQVLTPLRVEAIRPVSLLAEWEIYSSLCEQGKPVDLIYFPDGQHILQKPRDRLLSQQGNVDWFRFWLQGIESAHPVDPGEYVRWRDMQRKRSTDKDLGSNKTGISHPQP